MKATREEQQKDRAFLDNIGGNPDDDSPRLAYARWLEEHDTGNGKLAARGEFIRVQCALSDPKTGTTQRPKLQAREEELLKEHRTEWERPLQWIPVTAITFQRGFIH